MSCIAFAYLQNLRLKVAESRGEKTDAICPATETDAP
jgi:hypothetical protein